MSRWCLSTLLTLTVVAIPAFAQFGGVRFPGQGGRYPGGQQNPNAPQNNNQVYGPTETLTGGLREYSASSLVIDAGDDRIVLVQIQNGTKYLSTMGKVKASDFEPGDHVTVEAIRDDNDHYYSRTITLNKKGSPEDKAAAAQAAGASSSSGGSGGGGSSDSDPDRPRLHRANSDGTNSAGGQTASTDAAASVPASTGSGSGGIDSGSTSRRAASSQSGGGQAANQSSTNQSSANQSAADDGPPVLRRNPPSSSSPSSSSSSSTGTTTGTTQVASARAPDSPRPSLSAEDIDGVTRVPVVSPSSAAAPDDAEADRTIRRSPSGVPGGSGGDDPVIEQAREEAFAFSETLPNYVVKQITNRYASGAAGRGRTSWQALDIVTTDLIYEDGKERYTNILVNGKPTRDIQQSGSWSEGEFASMLQAILAPETQADFRNQRSVTIINRTAWRYDYTVEQPRSTWSLRVDGQSVTPSYTGSIWIDKATYRVLRIEIASRNVPRDFPLDTAESSIDYDFVLIGDQKVLLPSQSDALSCVRGTSDCTKNHTEFHNYRKYGAETNITFEGGADK